MLKKSLKIFWKNILNFFKKIFETFLEKKSLERSWRKSLKFFWRKSLKKFFKRTLKKFWTKIFENFWKNRWKFWKNLWKFFEKIFENFWNNLWKNLSKKGLNPLEKCFCHHFDLGLGLRRYFSFLVSRRKAPPRKEKIAQYALINFYKQDKKRAVLLLLFIWDRL